jgi:uncharacterized protein (DUF2236 family)
LGLRDQDMPKTLEGFNEWYAWMLAERIENNRTVRDALLTIKRPNPPHGFPPALWPIPRELAAHAVWLTTVGTLPRSVRERLDLPWNFVQEVQLSAIGSAFRTLRLVPAHWFYLPPAREAFGRA